MPRQLKQSEVKSVLDQLKKKQGNKCAICGRPFTRYDYAVLDHNHDNGYIRGALHNSCNGIEGRMKTLGYRSHKGVSSAEYIIGLGKYLEKHQTPQYKFIHPTHTTDEQKRLLRNKKAREARARKKANQ